MSVLTATHDILWLVETWALSLLSERKDVTDLDVLLAPPSEMFDKIARFPVIEDFAETFALTRGELGLTILLLAAAKSARVATKLHTISPNSEARGLPTWLALEALPGIALGDLAASSPLRLMNCIEVEKGVLPIEAHLRLDLGLVDRFCGLPVTDRMASSRATLVNADESQSDDAAAAHLASALSARNDRGLSPMLLAGSHTLEGVAASLASLGMQAWRMFAEDIPEDAEQRDQLARVWSREAALARYTLILVSNPQVPEARLLDFVDRIMGHVILMGDPPANTPCREVTLVLYEHDQNNALLDKWQAALGPQRTQKVGPRLDAIARQFALHKAEISALCRDLGPQIDNAKDSNEASNCLWHAAARVVGPENVPGVQLVEPAYTWDDIVLPEAIEQRLSRIEGHVRHSSQVMDEWGFAQRMGGKGRGISVLLSGQSGTGKSMAAEVLAQSLDLRVMFIDLSQLISKYIGDTSKNVAAVFRLAERSGAVMVWNEGDAIWGARGTVGNATDRHVNAEVGDLLQRIENFRGFTIVTTNMRHAIDEAFTRRFRFCLNFPMPSERERLLLWRKAFPPAAPIAEIDWEALAKVQLTGGSIRNIALSSAFCAAELGQHINREIVAAEIIEEFRKHDRPAPSIDWKADPQ